jgi:hypothetical protein
MEGLFFANKKLTQTPKSLHKPYCHYIILSLKGDVYGYV